MDRDDTSPNSAESQLAARIRGGFFLFHSILFAAMVLTSSLPMFVDVHFMKSAPCRKTVTHSPTTTRMTAVAAVSARFAKGLDQPRAVRLGGVSVRRARSSQATPWSVLILFVFLGTGFGSGAESPPPARPPATGILVVEPPEHGFFARRLDFAGIPIKASTNVADEALLAAWDRLSMMLSNLPSVCLQLRAAGAELHVIGRHEVTTDLPEWRQDKGKRLAEYNGLTRDERTRGMGGLLASCGEENLLRLATDRYRGRDICVHEFAHTIFTYGVTRAIREKFAAQRQRSLARSLWVGCYAGSNADEFFAELAMWYFGTRGDLGMKGDKPADGPAGLKAYDPEAFALLDDFYRGRMESAGRNGAAGGTEPDP